MSNDLKKRHMIDNKFSLGFFPTPLHRLNNLSEMYSGYNIYIKRDDQTGLASGGNKTRKLEYLIHQAIDEGYETVITAGAQQSNHCRQTAAACAVAGLKCHLVLRGKEPQTFQGNLLLSYLLGAEIHFTGSDSKKIDLEEVASKLDKKPYIIPYGGSNVIGALGYVNAVKELKAQLDEQNLSMDYIFFASSSGGTQAGLILGMELFGLQAELVPVKIDKDETYGKELEEAVLKIVEEGATLLQIKRKFKLDDITVNKDYNKADYGVLTDNERTAIRILAEKEGIMLDPVYTGRAFYGMLSSLKNKEIERNANVLFWHTGGLPALFDYADGLKL